MSVRVRFAPSPTGYLHIGNARACLINYLFALKHQGDLILRIDDTDKERSLKEYEDAIFKDLEWLGISWSKTFRQSERFDRYNAVIEELKKLGHLYPCFETPEELDFKRKRQLARKEPPIYDRASLSLTIEQKEAYIKEGRTPHWRFKLKDGQISWKDLVRGDVHFQASTLSDPVLIRGDGVLLYSLASVIDDVDTNITHIIRGEDHVTNTATQIQIFEALGYDVSKLTFAHTTLLTDASGQGFSKRLGSLSLGNLRSDGINPMAINSLLARLGTSLPVEPLFSLKELSDGFDLSTFSRTPPKFDVKELELLNQKMLHLLSFEDVKEQLPSWCTKELWDVLKSDLHHLQDINAWENIVCGELQEFIFTEDQKTYLAEALIFLPKSPWDNTTWKNWTDAIKASTGKKGRELFMPLRLALTGREHGPEMKELLVFIGYEKVLKRLKDASE